MKSMSKVQYIVKKLFEKGKIIQNDTIEIPEAEYKELNFKYETVFEEKFINRQYDKNIWVITPVGPSYWNINMGGIPQVLRNDNDGYFLRLKCIKDGDTSLCTGIKTAIAYEDGKFECEARFKGGDSSWPAIWMSHPNGGANNYETYYEVDISEYYEIRDNTDSTYHCPQSIRGGDKYVQPTKTPIKKNAWNKFEWTWDETSITISINGEQIMNIENDGDPLHYPINAENRTFIILLSMQYGHNPWLNESNLEDLPLYMDVRNMKYSKKIN